MPDDAVDTWESSWIVVIAAASIALSCAAAFPSLTYRGCGNIAGVTARWP